MGPTDKTCNDISTVCKKSYIEQSLRQLVICDEISQNEADTKTYKQVDDNIDDIIKDHISFTKKHFPKYYLLYASIIQFLIILHSIKLLIAYTILGKK